MVELVGSETHLRARTMARAFAWLSIVAVLALALAGRAQAQAVNTYTNTADIAIPNNSCPVGVTRTFTVTDSFDVQAVAIGIVIEHRSRGDIRATLESPSGTVVTLISNVGGTRNHLNVLFDPTSGTSITTHTTLNDDVNVAPYQRTFAPSSSLAAFTDADSTPDSAGTWTLRLCDSAGNPDGDFRHANLYLVEPFADLSLTKTVNNANPQANGTVTYTLTATNAANSSGTATGVTVQDSLPSGFFFTGSGGAGSFDSGTGVWNVGSIAPGASASITITGIAYTSATTETNTAEITASSLPDLDSIVDNGSTTEDDYAAVSYTTQARTAGTVPTVSCPAGSTLFDWTGKTWTVGTVPYVNSYVVSGVGTFTMTLSGNATHVTGTPTINTNLTGGFAADQSLFLNMNNAAIADTATVTIQFPTAVPGLQFRLYDIDYGANSYADKVTVAGIFNGASVTPTLTHGTSNRVLGNTAEGDLSATDTTAAGNVAVSFTAPVDTVTITYGNHTTGSVVVPANPGNQHMAISNFSTICNPVAVLSVIKDSSVLSDLINGATNPKAIPGATMRYCILVTNPGSGTATSISASDALPAATQFVPGSMRSGNNCTTTTTVEDDNATGADESDPIGASITGTTITATRTSLGPTASFALTFDVLVN